MAQDELALRQLLAQRRRERGHPRLRLPVPLVHRVQILVVDVDPVELVREHELRHRVCGGGRVGPGRGRLVRLAERGHDDVDACFLVCSLRGSALRGREGRVCRGLVGRAFQRKEREGDDVPAL